MALKTPISILQELMVAKGLPFPDYTFQSIGSQVQPKFSCTVRAASVTAVAVAANKKDAKQKAAGSALEQLQKSSVGRFSTTGSPDICDTVTTTFLVKTPPKDFQNGLNYIGKLNEFSARYRCTTGVKYEDIPFGSSGMFQVKCMFNQVESFGYALNKKQAKQIAAFEMLEKLKNMKIQPIVKVNEEENLRVMETFIKLSHTQIQSTEKIRDVKPTPNIKVNSYGLEEAIKKLKDLNLTYHVETLQKEPCIVAVQLRENSVTALGTGENEAVATTKAMNKVLGTLSVGCSFTS